MTGKFDLGYFCNGILGGLVSITASCVVVTPFAALIIGVLGGMVCVGASKLMLKFQIDDALDAFAVHGACGAFGVICVGLFCTKDYTYNGMEPKMYGLFYGGGGLLGNQLLLVLLIFLWVGGLTLVLFMAMKMAGVLRVSDEIQDAGIDVHEHEGPAYAIVVTSDKTLLAKSKIAPAA